MPSLKPSRMAVAFSLLLASSVVSPSAWAATKTRDSALAFHDAMRKLWEDHITWTRLYIVSAAASLPDQQPTAERLLQNQADIGNALRPFYGDAAGDQLTALLRDHILIAAELIDAAKANDAPRSPTRTTAGMPMPTRLPRS